MTGRSQRGPGARHERIKAPSLAVDTTSMRAHDKPEVFLVRRRIFVLFVVFALTAGIGLAAAPSRPAAAVPWGWSASGDYATEELGDPWDFSNNEDWDTQARLESPGLSSATVGGGTLNFTTASPAGGVLIGSAHYGPDALQWGRSTWLRPINGSTFTTLTFRMYSPYGEHAAGVDYFTCGFTIPSCAGHLSFLPQQGWHEYSFTPAWAGQNIYSILIVPNGFYTGSYQLDWVRVTRAGGQTTPPASSGSTEPVPVVIDPDRRGGIDYAASQRGNAWDFNDASDLAGTDNLDSISFANGQMHECNTSNDPVVRLPLAAPIDGWLYHHLSMRITYDGGWGLGNVPGGGLVARVYYELADVPGEQVSEDIVVYPGANDIDLDLSGAINEQDLGGGPGWVGHVITAIRIHPHEDPGRRCFNLDDVSLRGGDVAAPSFPIQFRDDANGTGAPSAGTTAEIWLDGNVGTFGGTRIAAGFPVGSGVNTFTWSGGGVSPGAYWVWIRLTDANGGQSSAYARGQLFYTGVPPLPANSKTFVNSGAGGADAVLTNLTMTEAPAAGFITADKCSSLGTGQQTASNGNFNPGQNIANLSVVQLDTNGQFCLFNATPVHLIADVQGAFSGGGALGFTRVGPDRVLDTRQTGQRVAADSVTCVQTGATGASAVLVNLTMTDGTVGGYITADLGSRLVGKPAQSNGNFVPARNIANLAVVPVTNGEFCIYAESPLHLVVDLQGYFSPSGGLELTLEPNAANRRRLDTRGGAMPGTGSVTEVTVNAPAGTEAVLANLTMTQSPAGGYITADICSRIVGQPQQSNGNFNAGQDIANLAVVPIENGRFCIYAESSVHLIADVQGYFSTGGDLRFTPSGPARVLDTRQP
jgi:hypothetical protein